MKGLKHIALAIALALGLASCASVMQGIASTASTVGGWFGAGGAATVGQGKTAGWAEKAYQQIVDIDLLYLKCGTPAGIKCPNGRAFADPAVAQELDRFEKSAYAALLQVRAAQDRGESITSPLNLFNGAWAAYRSYAGTTAGIALPPPPAE